MTESKVPMRHEVVKEYTWNAQSVFPSEDHWQVEYRNIEKTLAEIQGYQGELGVGPAELYDGLQQILEFKQRVERFFVYAQLGLAVDTMDQAATARVNQALGLYGRVHASIAFVGPEIIGIGQEKLDQWLKKDPRLAVYSHYFTDLFRKQAHVRSAEVEQLLGSLEDTFSGPYLTYSMITDSDFKFAPATTDSGQILDYTQGTVGEIMGSDDRLARKTTWENRGDVYLAFKNTLASNLSTSIKQNVFNMRARGHGSTLSMALHADNLPVDVFDNLIKVFRENLPIWHRYWSIRRRALKLDDLHPYDIWAPLSNERPFVSYRQAVEWICQALAPLGDEYVTVMRKGCLEERWVDVYPNQGKSSGAFSWGAQGTHPFIVMNYTDDVLSLGTLAHELGHSMHSYLSWQNQPAIYADYSLFVAEVASNFHQAMLRAYLLEQNPGPALEIGIIEEAMANFHRYFLEMPTLARFELETHRRVENGAGLTADDMIELLADLFSEGYGQEMHLDRRRVGISWAYFGHLYSDYYVYQYATGISGAHALAERVLSGKKNAAHDYLSFLKAGGSVHPLDALKMAGVDLSEPEPIEETYATLSKLVDRLEILTADQSVGSRH